MTDLIENKTRQLEHDAKNLDFGREDEEDNLSSAPAPSKQTATASKTIAKKQPSTNDEKTEKGPGKLIYRDQLVLCVLCQITRFLS